MAEYINIKGQNIEVVASDPANPTLGQIWYNSTSNTLKGQAFQLAAWATGNNMNTARSGLAGTGTQTAALGASGEIPGSPSVTAATEEYDGTNWTNSNNMNTGRALLGGAGTQTAALAFGGSDPVVPANANAAFTVPALPNLPLAVFILLPVAQAAS